MNAMEKLATEIIRVTKLREEYRRLDGRLGVNAKFALMGIDRALEMATKANASNDVVEVIFALNELEGWIE